MRILIFTNYNRYLATHEAFKLDLFEDWHKRFGLDFFIRISEPVDIDYHKYPNFYFTSVAPEKTELKKHIDEALKKFKPQRVINFLEKFFPFNLVETDAEKIYFVRSCAAKLLQRLESFNNESQQFYNCLNRYKELAEREKKLLNLSDRYLTTSITSVNAVKELYGIECELCLEFINPTKYREVDYGLNKNLVYNIGRRDFQKGLQFVKSPENTKFISIGKKEVGADECVNKNIECLDVLDFNEYRSIIQECVYGIYPSIWESNGYAVQECLAMGKIPIVQKNSGGNERHLTKDNSFVIDFNLGNTSWEQIIEQNLNFRPMQEAAKEAITFTMHNNSLEQFIEKIHT